jgi:glucose-6-phosphate isomerase
MKPKMVWWSTLALLLLAGRVAGRDTTARAKAWSALQTHVTKRIEPTHLRDLLADDARNEAMRCEALGVTLDFSRQRATPETFTLLLDLARACGVEASRDAMLRGDAINKSERRAVLHTALRAPRGTAPILVDGEDVLPAIHQTLDRVEAFADAVRAGARTGVTGAALTDVVVIGIGGSSLGPACVHEALRSDAACAAAAAGRSLTFVSNVDPVDVARALAPLDPATTLVVVVSKTFTTAETMLNARLARDWLIAALGDAPDVVARHVVAVSSDAAAAGAFGVEPANVFGFGDYVGGRYSVHAPVGALPLALHFGMAPVRQFLAGAHEMDEHFAAAPLASNLPVLLALCGAYNSAFLGCECKAVLPYAQALSRFPAHVQQLDMEVGLGGCLLVATIAPRERIATTTPRRVWGEYCLSSRPRRSSERRSRERLSRVERQVGRRRRRAARARGGRGRARRARHERPALVLPADAPGACRARRVHRLLRVAVPRAR